MSEINSHAAGFFEALKSGVPADIIAAADLVIDDWADEVFRAKSDKQREEASEHQQLAETLRRRVSAVEKAILLLTEPFDVPAADPPAVWRVMSRAAASSYSHAEDDFLAKARQFVADAHAAIARLENEVRFSRLDYHALNPFVPQDIIMPRGKRGGQIEPQYFRLSAVLTHLTRSIGSEDRAVRHVSTRICRRWLTAEIAADQAGTPMTDAEFTAVWGPTVTRRMSDQDRIEKLVDRFDAAHRRARERFFLPFGQLAETILSRQRDVLERLQALGPREGPQQSKVQAELNLITEEYSRLRDKYPAYFLGGHESKPDSD